MRRSCVTPVPLVICHRMERKTSDQYWFPYTLASSDFCFEIFNNTYKEKNKAMKFKSARCQHPSVTPDNLADMFERLLFTNSWSLKFMFSNWPWNELLNPATKHTDNTAIRWITLSESKTKRLGQMSALCYPVATAIPLPESRQKLEICLSLTSVLPVWDTTTAFPAEGGIVLTVKLCPPLLGACFTVSATLWEHLLCLCCDNMSQCWC